MSDRRYFLFVVNHSWVSVFKGFKMNLPLDLTNDYD